MLDRTDSVDGTDSVGSGLNHGLCDLSDVVDIGSQLYKQKALS